MSNAKKLKKKKELPEEFVKEVSTLCWVANKIQIPALGRVALQFNLKYGEKFESKIAKKAKNVDEEVVNMFDYKPHKSEIKKSTEEFKAAWEQRQKEIEEELARLEAEREEARRKLEESSSSSESSSDSDSDSDKPKKKSHKKSKKESSSSESESEEEKPKKAAKTEEKPAEPAEEKPAETAAPAESA